jgi:hypothetical protein
MFKVVKNYCGYEFVVMDVETGEIAEAGHETLEEAQQAAKNFNEWN